MRRRLFISLVLSCVMLLLATSTALAEDSIDVSSIDKGIFSVAHSSDARLKIKVTHGADTPYYYDLNNGGKKETFPLQMGNGAYKIQLLENTTGNSYKMLQSKDVTLNLSDPNQVYLNSVQGVEWKSNPNSVSKAAELTKDLVDARQVTSALWTYMAQNNKYDYDKLTSLPSTYLPSPDKTLAERMGICYDFSSLYAAMLRSEGIPTRLVKGYAPAYATGYHAWNEVYDAAQKQWLVIDSTYDLQMYASEKSITMEKPASGYQKVYQY